MSAPFNIPVKLPAILGEAVGTRELRFAASSVRDVVDAMRRHRKLGPMIFNEAGALRQHVIIFLNDTAIQHITSLDRPLTEQDCVAVVQAVSGG